MWNGSMLNHFKIFIPKFLLIGGLIGIALIERLWFDLGPNVELITVVTFIAAFYLGKKAAIIIPLVTLAISDAFIGNTSIALFTWSAYIVIGLISYFISKSSKSTFTRILIATGGGAGACVWFYLWTNFGVWLLDSLGMYSKDLSGLIASYIAGIPFLRNQLVSNLIIVPTVFSVIELIRNWKYVPIRSLQREL